MNFRLAVSTLCFLLHVFLRPPHISGAHTCMCQWACLILWTPRVSPGSLTPRPPGSPPPPATQIWHSDSLGAFSSLSFSLPLALLQWTLLLHYSSKDARAYTDASAVSKMGFVLAYVSASHMAWSQTGSIPAGDRGSDPGLNLEEYLGRNKAWWILFKKILDLIRKLTSLSDYGNRCLK